MAVSIRENLRYWRTSLADGALGEGKFTQADRKRFVDVPSEAVKSGVLPSEAIERVFRGQASARTMGIRFWPLVMARKSSHGAARAGGLRTPGLKGKLEELEARIAEIDGALATPAPTTVRLHPNLSAAYRRKVSELSELLRDPETAVPALEAIRSLIERVTVHETAEGVRIELEGAITALIDLAQGATTKSPLCSGLDVGSVKVVAGAGFEPAAFRL